MAHSSILVAVLFMGFGSGVLSSDDSTALLQLQAVGEEVQAEYKQASAAPEDPEPLLGEFKTIFIFAQSGMTSAANCGLIDANAHDFGAMSSDDDAFSSYKPKGEDFTGQSSTSFAGVGYIANGLEIVCANVPKDCHDGPLYLHKEANVRFHVPKKGEPDDDVVEYKDMWAQDRLDQEAGMDGDEFLGDYVDRAKIGEAINVYVIASGIKYEHEEFRVEVGDRTLKADPAFEWSGGNPLQCSMGDGECAYDRHGVGTRAASLVNGNLYGIAKSAIVHAVKVINDDGDGSFVSVGAGMHWVSRKALRPAIALVPVAAAGRSYSMRYSVEAMVAANIVVVVAAGDGGADACEYSPSHFSSASAIGGTSLTEGGHDKKSTKSNYGKCIDLYAPANKIKGAGLDTSSSYDVDSGTAYSSAFAAAGFAMMLTMHPGLHVADEQRPNMETCNARKGSIQALGANPVNRFLYLGECSCTWAFTETGEECDGVQKKAAGVTEGSGSAADEAARDSSGGGASPGRRDGSAAGGKKGKAAAAEAEASTCFPGEATAQVYGHGRMQVADLRAGDKILGVQGYEAVLGFLHEKTSDAAFLTVTHADGEFRASANHLVFVGGVAKAVADLAVGDELSAGKVLSVSRGSSVLGMYAPLTASGTIVVDGVVASTYAVSSSASWLPHSVAHAILYPVRVFHKIGLASLIASRAVSSEEMHPFLEVVHQQLRLDLVHKFVSV